MMYQHTFHQQKDQQEQQQQQQQALMQNYQQAMTTQISTNSQNSENTQQYLMTEMPNLTIGHGMTLQQVQMIHAHQQQVLHQQQQQQILQQHHQDMPQHAMQQQQQHDMYLQQQDIYQHTIQQQHSMQQQQQLPNGMVLVQAPMGYPNNINAIPGSIQQQCQPQLAMMQIQQQQLQQQQLKTVTSSGMLLPIVSQQPVSSPQMIQTIQSALVEDNGSKCGNLIQQALNDPNLASAGHLLLQSMHASTSFMNSFMDQHSTDPFPGNMMHFTGDNNTEHSISSLDNSIGQKQLCLTSIVESRHDYSIPTIGKGVEDTHMLLAPADPQKKKVSTPPRQHNLLPSSPSHGPATTKHSLKLSVSQSAESNIIPLLPPFIIEKHKLRVQRRHGKQKSIAAERKGELHKASCGEPEKLHRQKATIVSFQGTPQQYLMAIIKERGYDCQRVTSVDAGYNQDPTPLQVASFGTELVKAVHSGDTQALKSLLDCGLSSNPCNSFGDSILSLVCKRGDEAMFQVFVDHGCDLQVSDSFGRTPLHHVAWAGTFSKLIIKSILDQDLHQLLVQDKQGKCALEYVRKERFPDWLAFLKESLNTYWPLDKSISPLLATTLPRERGPAPDPVEAVSVELATQVAMGKISVEEVAMMDGPTRKCFNKPPPEQKFTLFGANMS